jgi:hypothetical protein
MKVEVEEAVNPIASHKAEETLRKQIADQCSVLNAQKADLDAKADVSALSA